MRAMIVEDDPVSATILRHVLRKYDLELVEAQNGQEAFELFQEQPCSLVVSDWMMPKMDGVELVQKLRELESPGYVYFIMVTAKSTTADRMQALDAGADDLLSKPYESAELQARIGVALRILTAETNLAERGNRLEKLTDQLTSANLMLRNAAHRFEQLFQGLPVPCFTFDSNGHVIECNRQFAQEYLRHDQGAHDVPLADLVYPKHERGQAESLLKSVLAGNRVTGAEHLHVAANGKVHSVLCSAFPVRQVDGEIFGGICASTDISCQKELQAQINEQMKELENQRKELAAANRKLSKLATTDGLTLLTNHRTFQEQLEKSMALRQRTDLSLSLLLLDVDHFKRFNDEYGHQAGDAVLVHVARILHSVARRSDTVARYGGEEFVVVLPGSDAASAMGAAERFRSAIESHRWTKRPVTVSVGVSTVTPETDGKAELIEQADKALYASKAAGRNCATHFQDLRLVA